jgi:gamma-glutamyltranspeptidase/glutathione hydrolase
MPPPGGGRELLLVLLMLNHYPPSVLTSGNPAVFHLWCETFRKAFLQRMQQPISPNYYLQSPDRTMTNPDFARTLVRSINAGGNIDLPHVASPNEGGETTHVAVMDAEDNVVSLSQSIESIYGAKAAAEGLGFMYNNYLNTLITVDPSHPYYLRPNAVPWSSVAPSIIFIKDKPWLAVGSPGSDRIYSTIAQFLSHIVDGNMSLYDAMSAPRLHCSLGGEVSIEAGRFDPSIVDYLSGLGYHLDRRKDYSFYLGAITAVMRCQSRPGYMGVAEIRRDGAVVSAQGSSE